MAVLLGNEGGGLYGGVILEIPITASQTWVPPRDGTVNIIAIGAGGSGALYTPANGGIALGGGAGGYCAKENLSVTTNGSYSISIGAGGVGVYSNGSVPGNAGGNTTVSGTGLSATITANGGAGGTGTATYLANSNYGYGAAGGTASGGDVNRVGGKGGGFAPGYVTSNTGTRCATGGGAVAILTDVGYQGGSFIKTGSNTSQLKWATGGAGIGGRGGGAWNIDGSFGTYGAMNGGSASGPGEDWTVVAERTVAPSGLSAWGMQQTSWKYQDLSLIGATRAIGGYSGINYAAGAGGGAKMPTFNAAQGLFPVGMPPSTLGAGGGGCYYTSTTSSIFAGFGGAFAGGGAMVSYGTYNNSIQGGTGGIGGGGGGKCSQQNYSSQQQWGGQGVVFINYTAFA